MLGKKRLSEIIRESRVFRWIYSQEQDFNIGRGFFGKFTALSNEFTLAILVTTVVFKVDITQHWVKFCGWVALVMLFVYLFGKFYRRMNLLEVDQRASFNRSPVGKLQLEAAELIIARYGRKKR